MAGLAHQKSGLLTKKSVLDRKLCTQIFPEEIWKLIFQHHSSSVDLRSVAPASKYFEHLLFPYRVQWMFRFVWQLIAARLVIRNLSQYHQWQKSLLTLRSVCRNWSKGVDWTFETVSTKTTVGRGIAWRNYSERVFGDRNSLLIADTEFINTNESCRRFLTHFASTHPNSVSRSPLFSKMVVIYSSARNITDPCLAWPECSQILSSYGNSVKHCNTAFLNYDLLCQILKLMPNLETLLLCCYLKQSHQTGFDSTEVANSSKHSLPRLPKLTFLNVRSAPTYMVEDMLGKCSNLSGFTCNERGVDISGLIAHPLKQLRVCVDLKAYNVLTKMSYSWPLTDLELKFDNDCFVEWPELFALVHQNWSKTLKRFKIALPGSSKSCYVEQIANWSLKPLLKLERLTHLTLTMNNFHSFDFILSLCSTLEYLSIRFNYSLKEIENPYENIFVEMKKKQVIKHLNNTAAMMGSNIWILFPRLKQIHFKSGGMPNSISRPW